MFTVEDKERKIEFAFSLFFREIKYNLLHKSKRKDEFSKEF